MCVSVWVWVWVYEEGLFLFNDVLNTFYLQVCGNGSLNKRGNPLLPLHGLLFPISNKGSFIYTIRQIG